MPRYMNLSFLNAAKVFTVPHYCMHDCFSLECPLLMFHHKFTYQLQNRTSELKEHHNKFLLLPNTILIYIFFTVTAFSGIYSCTCDIITIYLCLPQFDGGLWMKTLHVIFIFLFLASKVLSGTKKAHVVWVLFS